MTNEQMAVAIQEGDTALIDNLWNANRGLAYSVAKRYRSVADMDRVASMEDLLQTAYLGFHSAIYAYQDGRGAAFTTVCVWHMQHALQDALGLRRRRLDALCTSLDMALPGSDSDTLLIDLVADPDTPDYAELAAMDDAARMLHEEVDKLPIIERAVIRLHYYDGLTLAKTAQACGLESPGAAANERERALRRLRYNKRLRKLIEIRHYDNIDESPYYAHVGTGAFRSSGQSAVELAATKRDTVERVRRQCNMVSYGGERPAFQS